MKQASVADTRRTAPDDISLVSGATSEQSALPVEAGNDVKSSDGVAQRIEQSEPDEGRKDAGSTPAAVGPSEANSPAAPVGAVLDHEEKYLIDSIDAESGLMPGDIEGSFHRVREAIASAAPVDAGEREDALADLNYAKGGLAALAAIGYDEHGKMTGDHVGLTQSLERRREDALAALASQPVVSGVQKKLNSESGNQTEQSPPVVSFRSVLEDIASADEREPREPDDADWQFRFFEIKRVVKLALEMGDGQTQPATEQEADSAIKHLKRAIEAAENSNQAGENAVVKAATSIGWASLLNQPSLNDGGGR